VTVNAEPVPANRFTRFVGKVPLLRRLKQPREYVPPKPIHEVRPVLSTHEQQSLTESVPLDVKVYVAESGKVEYAEPLREITQRQRPLAAAAVYAARRWTFTPARTGEQKIPGEVILHFRFKPDATVALSTPAK
jgi:hypothetical protein